jgi:hypothetical protein
LKGIATHANLLDNLMLLVVDRIGLALGLPICLSLQRFAAFCSFAKTL